ncbi:MAG: sigma-70 family RNA polymerase sigma factor [Clostridia bacterium]
MGEYQWIDGILTSFFQFYRNRRNGETSKFGRLFAKSKEPALRQTLIESNLRLVLFVVRRLRCYVPPSMEREDLVSCGIIGLIEAVDRFDPTRGFEFSTFAVKRIRGRSMMAFANIAV